jgi:hypothetical protein
MDSWRWKTGDDTYQSHWYGTSAHLIAWHDSDELWGLQEPADFTEVVYAMGGSVGGINGSDCSEAQGYSAHMYTEKMVFPDHDAEWEDTMPLWSSRVFHNTVILADGSLLTVGGVNAVDGECAARVIAERYEPIEIFDGSDEDWHELADQRQKRGYHSIACLLPDGTVVSGGGDDMENETLNSEQSVEVFRPPYCYPDEDRPAIEASDIEPETSKTWAEEIEFDVTLSDETTDIARVAIIRPSSVTHGVDMSQRYVQLAITSEPTQVSERQKHVTVQMPINKYYAPAGHYMLFVIDSDGLASEAVWIHLLP